MLTIPANEVVVGHTLNPICQPTYTHEPHTVEHILEYPSSRVFYFQGGGYVIADRRAQLELP